MSNNVHALHRRAVLTGASATAAALVASTIPAEPAPVETARDTINRAGKEIAEALNHYDDGKWHALIYPSEKVKDGLWLGNRMEYVGLDVEQKLVGLIQKWRKAKEAEDRAADALSKAEAPYFAERGKFEERPTPDHLFEARRDMRLRDLGDKSHPVNVALAAFHKEEADRRAEWEAKRDATRAATGVEKAEARHIRAIDRTNRAFDAIVNTPTLSLEGIRLKVEVINEHYRHCEIDRDVWEALFADIMQAPGYLS